MERKYYEAYDDRYRQVHKQNMQWFCDNPSPIVEEVIREFHISTRHKCLELGCGEGRDAICLLDQGFNLLATDISAEAIAFCRKRWPQFAEQFQTLDCVAGKLDGTFDLVYAVAVVHMLVPDEDRNGFYTFVCDHLSSEGIALICTMGDGSFERQSDIRTAFDLQSRVHEGTGKAVEIAGTSCRIVSFESFENELARNGLAIIKQGITTAEPDFSQMMYAVVRRA